MQGLRARHGSADSRLGPGHGRPAARTGSGRARRANLHRVKRDPRTSVADHRHQMVTSRGPKRPRGHGHARRPGRRVLVLEAEDRAGGGLRTEALTRPGFEHDVCSAIHPLGVGSPALRELPLAEHGVEWVHPTRRSPTRWTTVGSACSSDRSTTPPPASAPMLAPIAVCSARRCGRVSVWSTRSCRPCRCHRSGRSRFARYGAVGIRPTRGLIRRRFDTDEAAWDASRASRRIRSSRCVPSPPSGYGMFLASLGHVVGWPMARGGSQTIADALVSILRAHGGEIVTGTARRAPR